MKLRLQVIVLLIWTTLITKLLLKFLGLERYGWVRFQGFFISPTQYFGSSSQQYMPSANQA
ncbi:hypothetical protein Gotur_014200 [Gossypium turneri]